MCSVPTNPHCSDKKREGGVYSLDRTPSPLISSSVKRALASARERPRLLESTAAQTSSRVRTPSLFVSMDSNRASNFPRRDKLLMAEAVKVRDGVDGSHPALKNCTCCCERLQLMKSPPAAFDSGSSASENSEMGPFFVLTGCHAARI